MNTIDLNKEKEYIQKIFNDRLSKSESKDCPYCGAPASRYYKPMEHKKYWKLRYCSSCSKFLSPLANTVLERTQLPIELWLHITRHILEKPDTQAKEIHLDFGVSMPTSYRAIEKVQAWQAQNNIHKTLRKRKIQRKYRTGTHLVYEMMLKTMPPLFSRNQTNFQKSKS